MGQGEEKGWSVCACASADLCGLLKPGFVRLGAGREKILAAVQRTLSRNEEDKTLLSSAGFHHWSLQTLRRPVRWEVLKPKRGSLCL